MFTNINKLRNILALIAIAIAVSSLVLMRGEVIGAVYVSFFMIIIVQAVMFWVVMVRCCEIILFYVLIVFASWFIFIGAWYILDDLFKHTFIGSTRVNTFIDGMLFFIFIFAINYLVLVVFPLVATFLFNQKLKNIKN